MLNNLKNTLITIKNKIMGSTVIFSLMCRKHKIIISFFSLSAFIIIGLLLSISDSYAGSVTSGCTPLPERLSNLKACVLCDLFIIILRTDQTVATHAFNALAIPFRNVTIMVLGLFIAYHTLMAVSGLTKQDTSKYVNKILIQTFKAFVVVLLLSNHVEIYKYVISPLIRAGLEFGLAFADSGGNNSIMNNFDNHVKQETSHFQDGVIPKDLLSSVVVSVELFSEAAAKIPAIGSTLICVSTHEAANSYIWDLIKIPNFEMWFQGMILFIIGWCIALSCCFYLLDGVVRFGIFCMLLPFLIASWTYKVTQKYTKAGWDIFMNTFFCFVMLGVVINLVSELLIQGITGGKSSMEEFEALINGNNISALEEATDIGGIDFIVLIASCMFAFKIVGKINELATTLAGGGGGSNIGAQLGGTAAGIAQKVGTTAFKAGSTAVKAAAAASIAGNAVNSNATPQNTTRNTQANNTETNQGSAQQTNDQNKNNSFNNSGNSDQEEYNSDNQSANDEETPDNATTPNEYETANSSNETGESEE